MLKSGSEKLLETGYSHGLKRMLLITNGKKILLQWRNLAEKNIVTKQVMGQHQHVPPDVMQLEVHNVI